ncbi:MAG: NAD-dependent epimerase/dehydratase family protein [Rhodospirillales bacterium]|nr:NAD-dependent epimerase/dehydratase family protein [Rhodospirillales bacterium]
MQIAVIGAGGFLGRKLVGKLAREGRLGTQPLARLVLSDLSRPPAPPARFPIECRACDVAALPEEAIPQGTDVVFHLAAIVSAAAEADFDLGMRVNLGGTERVIAACRRLSHPPRVVFTSSVASFSGGQNAVLGDDARQIPANSYGAQKAASELILQDASRRGFLDAVNLRLPTVIVRPGRPNRAASSFVSAIIREPLLGLSAELPVSEDFAVWVASPRRVIDWLAHAAALDSRPMGVDRGINPPGLSVSVREMLAALESVKPGAASLVRRVEDPEVAGIIASWPAAFVPERASRLGFAAHEPLGELLRAFIEEDLPATRAERGPEPVRPS